MTGARIAQDLLAFVKADERIRPLRDQIVLEPLDWEPSKTLTVAYRGKALRGKVRAVGPGRYLLKYDGPKGRRTKSWLSSLFRPTEVKVGDVVELGGLEIGGYLFPTIRWGDKDVVLCREGDVTGIVA
jgi:co-chaperonin GroES (HSP10)